MTEEIIMFNKSDVESLEEAIKRLEFELKVTKADYEASEQENRQMKSVLEEIRENLVKLKTNDEDDFTYEYSKIEDKINEVLGDEKVSD